MTDLSLICSQTAWDKAMTQNCQRHKALHYFSVTETLDK